MAAFKNKAAAAKGQAKHNFFASKAVLTWDNLTLADQKCCWEQVVVILDSQNRPVHLKPVENTRVHVSWMLIISYCDV